MGVAGMTTATSPPRRIQRKRTAGWRMPEGALYVGRPSRWGNPFHVGAHIADSVYFNAFVDGVPYARDGVVEDRAHALELYAFWIMLRVPFTRAEVRAKLRGKDLACWCPESEPCHADLLLDIANGEEGR